MISPVVGKQVTLYYKIILFFKETKIDETKTAKTYKGVHFGKLTSKRTEFGGKTGPGPGEYEPYAEMQLRPENLNAIKEEQPRYEANIPRYHEAITKEVEKKVENPQHRHLTSTLAEQSH